MPSGTSITLTVSEIKWNTHTDRHTDGNAGLYNRYVLYVGLSHIFAMFRIPDMMFISKSLFIEICPPCMSKCIKHGPLNGLRYWFVLAEFSKSSRH